MAKQKILELLNHALELEHAAYTQYLSHAENVDGINAEPIIACIAIPSIVESEYLWR